MKVTVFGTPRTIVRRVRVIEPLIPGGLVDCIVVRIVLPGSRCIVAEHGVQQMLAPKGERGIGFEQALAGRMVAVLHGIGRLPATPLGNQCLAPHLAPHLVALFALHFVPHLAARVALHLAWAFAWHFAMHLAPHLAPHLLMLDAAWHLAWLASVPMAAAGRATMAAVSAARVANFLEVFMDMSDQVEGGVETVVSRHGGPPRAKGFNCVPLPCPHITAPSFGPC